MKKEKFIKQNPALFSFGQNIYFKKRRTNNIFYEIAKRFLFWRMYAKNR